MDAVVRQTSHTNEAGIRDAGAAACQPCMRRRTRSHRRGFRRALRPGRSDFRLLSLTVPGPSFDSFPSGGGRGMAGPPRRRALYGRYASAGFGRYGVTRRGKQRQARRDTSGNGPETQMSR